jgi:hypothetical protein
VLLGVLAFLAPLPLPFNEPRPEGVVGFPFLLPYLVAVCWFIGRAAQDRERWLRPWMLNVLGLLYVPFFLFDLSTFWRGHLVRPMMHLAMFAMVAKLFSLQRERDKWQALVGIFFLFLAAMATSSHPAIVVYLVVFCSLLLGTLVRFAAYHVTGAFPCAGGTSLPPLRSFLALSTLFALVLSVPIFLALPRVRTPYVLGRGISGTQVGYSTGFSDEVSLDIVGNIRGSREVALRVQFEAGDLTSGDLRFRGAVYEDYQELRWRRSPLVTVLRAEGRAFHLAPGEVREWMRIWLQPLRANSLILPVRTLELEIPVRAVGLSRGGTVSMRDEPHEVLQYRAGLGRAPALVGSPPEGDADPTLSQAGVTERLAELASRVAGDGTPAARARRIESHLIAGYEYTLDFVGRRAEDPIEDFLFTYRSGHCEYFASAMVLMLRSQGIPARFVTGFLGGEYNPLEGYFIVRQSNAHAWVEAFLPEQGWQTYDPTPPSGRPSSDGSSLRLLLRQAYDYVLFRWDRYILSYGFEDQIGVVTRLRELLTDLWKRARFGETERSSDSETAAGRMVPGEPTGDAGRSLAPPRLLAAVGVVLVAGLLVWWLRRAPRSATAAYRRLRRRAARHGITVSPALGPAALRARLERRFPGSAAETGGLIDLYLRESFAGHRLTEEERVQLDELLARASRGLRKAS